MQVVLVQHNRAYGAFETRSRRALNATDTARADALAASLPAMESGYFDVLLLRGRPDAAAFSDAALAVPRAWYENAIDHVIAVR
jgi:hypothetical protein